MSMVISSMITTLRGQYLVIHVDRNIDASAMFQGVGLIMVSGGHQNVALVTLIFLSTWITTLTISMLMV